MRQGAPPALLSLMLPRGDGGDQDGRRPVPGPDTTGTSTLCQHPSHVGMRIADCGLRIADCGLRTSDCDATCEAMRTEAERHSQCAEQKQQQQQYSINIQRIIMQTPTLFRRLDFLP